VRVLSLTHLYPRFEGDNLGVYIRQMYDRLAARHSIRVLCPRAPRMETRAAQAGRVEVAPFPYGLPRRWSTFGYGGGLTGDQKLSRTSLLLAPFYSAAAVERVWRERRGFDVLHAHFLVPNGTLAALASGGRPLAISLHGSDVYLAERFAPARGAARVALEHAAAIIPCSEDLGRRVIALGADPSKVHVIPYGVDSSVFDTGNRESGRNEIRARLGAGTRPVILFVGNLLPKKGVTFLLSAAAEVRRAHPEALFAIVGDGALRADLERQASGLGLGPNDVRFAGAVPWAEIPSWHAAADVFVVPSVVDSTGNVDGLPNVVLEAMASGLPVVATDVGGLPMVVRPRETGLLVPPEDPSALAAALSTLLADRSLASSCGSRARAFLESELSWERIAARYETLFESILGTRKAAA
jgi:glycosyltransferase involved in cell wall biosynthesis